MKFKNQNSNRIQEIKDCFLDYIDRVLPEDWEEFISFLLYLVVSWVFLEYASDIIRLLVMTTFGGSPTASGRLIASFTTFMTSIMIALEGVAIHREQ